MSVELIIVIAKYDYNKNDHRWKFNYGATYEPYSAEFEFDSWLSDQSISNGFFNVEKEGIKYFVFAGENRRGENETEEIKKDFTDVLKDKIKKIKESYSGTIIVFLHSNLFNKNDIDELKVETHIFRGDQGKIDDIVEGGINVSKILKCIKGEISPLTVNDFFLKTDLIKIVHHLAHLFLPLDIDLQGICEVLSSESSPPSGKSKDEWAEECYRKAKAYYDEAFNDKSPKEIFEEKLGKAKEIVESEAPDEVKNQILEKLEDNGVKKLKGQLGRPGSEGDLQTFKEWIKENNNHFHDWFCGLMEWNI